MWNLILFKQSRLCSIILSKHWHLKGNLQVWSIVWLVSPIWRIKAYRHLSFSLCPSVFPALLSHSYSVFVLPSLSFFLVYQKLQLVPSFSLNPQMFELAQHSPSYNIENSKRITLVDFPSPLPPFIKKILHYFMLHSWRHWMMLSFDVILEPIHVFGRRST